MTPKFSFRLEPALIVAIEQARQVLGETRTDFIRTAAYSRLRRLRRVRVWPLAPMPEVRSQSGGTMECGLEVKEIEMPG